MACHVRLCVACRAPSREACLSSRTCLVVCVLLLSLYFFLSYPFFLLSLSVSSFPLLISFLLSFLLSLFLPPFPSFFIPSFRASPSIALHLPLLHPFLARSFSILSIFLPQFSLPSSLPPSPAPSLSPSKFAYEARKPQDGKAKTKEGNEPKPAIRRRADTEKKEAHLENGNGNGNPCRGGGVEKRKWMEKMERRRKEYLRAGNQ